MARSDINASERDDSGRHLVRRPYREWASPRATPEDVHCEMASWPSDGVPQTEAVTSGSSSVSLVASMLRPFPDSFVSPREAHRLAVAELGNVALSRYLDDLRSEAAKLARQLERDEDRLAGRLAEGPAGKLRARLSRTRTRLRDCVACRATAEAETHKRELFERIEGEHGGRP